MNSETTETNHFQQQHKQHKHSTDNHSNNNNRSAQDLNTKDQLNSLNQQIQQSDTSVIFPKKQTRNFIDPLKVAKIIKKILNLVSKSSVVEEFKALSPLDYIFAVSAAGKSAACKRKLRMEDPYYHQFRVWTTDPLPLHKKSKFNQGLYKLVCGSNCLEFN